METKSYNKFINITKKEHAHKDNNSGVTSRESEMEEGPHRGGIKRDKLSYIE